MSSLPHRLDAALKRILTALDHLDAAVERRVEIQNLQGDLAQEYAVMQDDRARLGIELDSSLARAQRLEAATYEAGKRLERASDTIKAILTVSAQD